MANATEKPEVKKKFLPKGKRLGWEQLKDAKPVVLTDEVLKSERLLRDFNGKSDSNLLVP